MRAIAAAEPSPAAVMTWARGLAALPATQTPGTVVRPVASVIDPAGVVEVAAQADEQVVFGHEPRTDEHRRSGDDPAVVQLDAGQPVVLDDEPRTAPSTTPIAAGGELRRARSAVSASVCGKKTTSADHWRTSCACWTASGVPPSTPSGWSRTS